MTGLYTLNETHAAPDAQAVADMNMKCRNCLHFASVAAFRVNGAPATCGSKMIERSPGDVPCPQFTFDTVSFLRLSPELRAKLTALTMEIDKERKAAGDETAPEMIAAAGIIESFRLRRRGLKMGGRYTFGGEKPRTGILLTINRTVATLQEVATGVVFRVPVDTLVYVPRRKVS